MPTKRAILEHFTVDELRSVVDRFEIEIEDRRARGGIIHAIATAQTVDLEPVLAEMGRERLKELCRKVGLDDSGRDKASIIARLLGRELALAAASVQSTDVLANTRGPIAHSSTRGVPLLPRCPSGQTWPRTRW